MAKDFSEANIKKTNTHNSLTQVKCQTWLMMNELLITSIWRQLLYLRSTEFSSTLKTLNSRVFMIMDYSKKIE